MGRAEALGAATDEDDESAANAPLDTPRAAQEAHDTWRTRQAERGEDDRSHRWQPWAARAGTAPPAAVGAVVAAAVAGPADGTAPWGRAVLTMVEAECVVRLPVEPCRHRPPPTEGGASARLPVDLAMWVRPPWRCHRVQGTAQAESPLHRPSRWLPSPRTLTSATRSGAAACASSAWAWRASYGLRKSLPVSFSGAPAAPGNGAARPPPTPPHRATPYAPGPVAQSVGPAGCVAQRPRDRGEERHRRRRLLVGAAGCRALWQAPWPPRAPLYGDAAGRALQRGGRAF